MSLAFFGDGAINQGAFHESMNLAALFEVPARTPVYFQAVDSRGHVAQTMRSWSTLLPGEKRTIKTELRAADARGEEPRIVVEGWNVAAGGG